MYQWIVRMFKFCYIWKLKNNWFVDFYIFFYIKNQAYNGLNHYLNDGLNNVEITY